MITRRRFSLMAGAAPAMAQSRPKNVLLMIADDLGLHTGAYGDSNARTPNLDKLAGDGVRFSNAFCTTASCSASRSVILSGLQNHANGQYGLAHATHHFGTLPGVQTTPHLLRAAGYRTGIVGKLHVNPLSEFPWDLREERETRSVGKMAETVDSFLRASAGRPFYLHVGFGDPHRAPGGFANKDYPGVKRTPFDPAKLKMPGFLPDTAAVRGEVAEYYEAANRMDQGVGMVMDALRRSGQLENTLVVFISDNGMPFPNAKTNCYDSGLHLPMIVRAPGQARRGLVNQAMVSWVDLVPTFLDWTGAKGPEYDLHGKSWLPVLEQESPAGWDEVYFSHTFHEVTMYYPMRGVRTREFKYIRNLFPELEYPHASDLFGSKMWQEVRRTGERTVLGSRPVGAYLHRAGEELYEVGKDPYEVRNLAGEPGHRTVVEGLRKRVQEYRQRTNDPWMILSEQSGEGRPEVKKMRGPLRGAGGG